MDIDRYYSCPVENGKDMGIPKENFYLGMVSQVYRESVYVQVENLSLLSHRNLKLEKLIPNTINYFVVIDSIQGIFIGEILQSKVKSSDSVHDSMSLGKKEDIYPEVVIDIIGLLDGDKFKLAGFKTVGITDKVYIANQALIAKYLQSIEINDYEGQESLLNLAKLDRFDGEFLSLQPNTLFDRHLMVIGTTNSGKSTSSLSILDKLIKSGRKVLIIDPTGEYSDAFRDDEADKVILGKSAFLSTEDIDDSFWIDFFDVAAPENSGKAAVLSDAISSLRYQSSKGRDTILVKNGKKVSDILPHITAVSSRKFNLGLLTEQIKNEAVKQVADKDNSYKFKNDGNLYNASIWLMQKISYFVNSSLITDFFNESNNTENLFEKLDKFISPDNKKTLYIDASTISKSNSSGKTIIDLISKYVIDKKISDDAFVLFIDEVHRYIDRFSQDDGLTMIAREGRKKGIFLFLTTQNPKDVTDVLFGQIGTMIIHRLTHHEELQAIQGQVQPNMLPQIRKLHQGEAILTSINLLQDLHVRFEESGRKHNNNTPNL